MARMILIALLAILFLYMSGFKSMNSLLAFIAWQLLVGIIAWKGFFMETPIFFVAAIILSVIFSFILVYKKMPAQSNTRWLLTIHLLRIPVELLLYQLYIDRQLPEVMTFAGWNYDILIGITASIILFISFFRDIPKKALLIWNVTGSMFLMLIVLMAILSSPLPIQVLGNEQPNIAVLQYPHYLLPTCIVPLVFFSHLRMIRSYVGIPYRVK